jgi:tetratricopeptide (TPR) repeat protein
MTAHDPLPKIQVGRDFRMGNTSGLVGIGDNIAQYQNCVFNLPDGSTLSGQSWLYTQGIRPSTDPREIFGRQDELEKIDDLFKHNSALAITGFRGTGKSTLASMYIDRLEKRGECAGIYWRKVDETIDISDVVGSFFSVTGKPLQELGRYKDSDLLDLFFRELNVAPYFLVLDNFESLLDPKTIRPTKPGFSDMIERAKKGVGRSQILFTSWECPSSDRGIRPICYTIGGLDESAALQLLKESGLSEPEDELKKVIQLSGGHPLALILLVQLVKEEEETLSNILADTTLWIGKEGEVAVNILDKVYEERLNEKEQKLLQYVSLYRIPVSLPAIVFVADDIEWTEATVKKLALNLKRKSLLRRTGEHYWEESLIDTYAYNKLENKREAHKLAYQYHLLLPLPEPRTKKEDVQSLIEAHHHACLAQEYDTAAAILFDHNLHEDLDRWGHSRTLIELYSGLLPKDPFNDKPVLTSIKTHGAVLGNLGNAYRALGQVDKAIKYYVQALVIFREIGDRRGEGTDLGNLGVAYSALGQVDKAIKYYVQALVIAREIGDRRGEGTGLGSLGTAYRALDQVKKAIKYYEQALVIFREIGDRRGEGNHLGNLGIAYSALGQVDKAIKYYDQALVISREIGDRRNEGNWLGNLGIAYSALGQMDTAIEHYDQALVISREIGDRRGEEADLGNLGLAYSALGQVDKAIEYYNQALVIAREIGDRRGEGNHLGNLGLAYRALDQVDKAIEYHNQALVIAREIGDRRGEGAGFGNLGNAYRALGQVDKVIEYHDQGLVISREIGDRRGEGNHLGNLGVAYSDLGQVDTAIEYYEQALVIAREIGDRRGEGNHLGNLGNAYRALGQVKKAIEYYDQALLIGKAIKDPRIISFCENALNNIV